MNAPPPAARDVAFQGLVQLTVTVALLVFAWAVQTNADVTQFVVGAVVTYWLGESQRLGRTLAGRHGKGEP